jgi:hypothetical protein
LESFFFLSSLVKQDFCTLYDRKFSFQGKESREEGGLSTRTSRTLRV